MKISDFSQIPYNHCHNWCRILALYQPLINQDTFAAQAAMMHLLLSVISPESKWTKRLYELIKDHSFMKPARMGFSANWQDDDFGGMKAE